MFQTIYDFIKNIKTPLWLKIFLAEVQKVLIATLLNIGREYLVKLENKIIEVAGTNMSNKDKFNAVYTYGKIQFPNIKESVLNALIEMLVLTLKSKGFIKIT